MEVYTYYLTNVFRLAASRENVTWCMCYTLPIKMNMQNSNGCICYTAQFHVARPQRSCRTAAASVFQQHARFEMKYKILNAKFSIKEGGGTELGHDFPMHICPGLQYHILSSFPS